MDNFAKGLKASHKLFFVPFPGLATQDKHGLPGSGHLLRLEQLLYSEKWTNVRKEAAELIQLSLDGLRYLETYVKYPYHRLWNLTSRFAQVRPLDAACDRLGRLPRMVGLQRDEPSREEPGRSPFRVTWDNLVG